MTTSELDDALRKERVDLRLVKGGKAGGAIEVRKVPFVIGRSGCDLNLEDGSVSRRHCEIIYRDERWLLHDLGSSNGTFINGEKIQEREAKSGDTLRAGQSEIRFTIRSQSGVAAGAREVRGIDRLIEDTAVWNLVELSVGTADARSWTKSYLETVMKQFMADRGIVVIYDAVTGGIMPAAVMAVDWEGSDASENVPLSRSIVEESISDMKIVMTTNAEVDPRFKDATSVAQYDIAAVVCAPARWQGHAVGALYIERSIEKKQFTEAESQQLQDLADLYGTAHMAWRGHAMSQKQEWERETLSRTFDDRMVDKLMARGGASSVGRKAREICVVVVHVSKVMDMVASGNQEAWRLVSQLYAQMSDVMQRRGGAMVAPGVGVFGPSEEEGEDYYNDAATAGMEIQRLARPLVKRLGRDMKLGMSLCVAIAGGEALVGYFGAGRRVDYHALGEVVPTAYGMAHQGENGEVLVEQTVHTKIRLHFKTHRMAPVMIAGAKGLTQLYRVVPY